jgi:uncharacterized protein YcbK (DUF882 family)
MHMKTKLAAGFVVFLMMLTTTACGGNSPVDSAPVAEPEKKQESPTNSCWLYEKYSVADCSSLTAISSLSRAVRDEYVYPSSSSPQYRKPTHVIDLTKVNLNQSVTKNFKLSEFMQAHKGRYAFFAEHVFGFVQKIRDQIAAPVSVTSAYRSPAYNKKIRGATVSRHMYGDALDLAGPALAQLEAACRAQNASYIQLYSDGHIHCDWRLHALDSTFYKSAAAALAGNNFSALSEEDFKAMQVDFVGQPIIDIKGTVAAGQEVEFVASLAEQEEEGALLTEWAIRNPKGEVFLSNDVNLKYKIQQSGTYNVYVRVGGYSDINYELVVP